MNPEAVKKLNISETAIRRAWISGVVVGTLQILFGFINPLYFLDAAVYYILAFGIYKRNRVLSIIMLLFSLLTVIQKVNQVLNGAKGQPYAWGITIYLIVTWLVFKGCCGVFVYHKITKSEEQPNADQKQ